MLHRGGTKIIVISGNRKGTIGQYATEFLYAAGSEKVEEFWNSMFLHQENICLIFYMAWNSADDTKRILR